MGENGCFGEGSTPAEDAVTSSFSKLEFCLLSFDGLEPLSYLVHYTRSPAVASPASDCSLSFSAYNGQLRCLSERPARRDGRRPRPGDNGNNGNNNSRSGDRAAGHAGRLGRAPAYHGTRGGGGGSDAACLPRLRTTIPGDEQQSSNARGSPNWWSRHGRPYPAAAQRPPPASAGRREAPPLVRQECIQTLAEPPTKTLRAPATVSE